MIEGCSGINIEVLADLPYRRGIASLFDKSPNKIEDLSLPGCQLHPSLLHLRLPSFQNESPHPQGEASRARSGEQKAYYFDLYLTDTIHLFSCQEDFSTKLKIFILL